MRSDLRCVRIGRGRICEGGIVVSYIRHGKRHRGIIAANYRGCSALCRGLTIRIFLKEYLSR